MRIERENIGREYILINLGTRTLQMSKLHVAIQNDSVPFSAYRAGSCRLVIQRSVSIGWTPTGRYVSQICRHIGHAPVGGERDDSLAGQ